MVDGTAEDGSGWSVANFPLMSGVSDKPVLAVDVDGVISLFGFDGPLDQVPGKFHLIDGVAHCIADDIGTRLLRLAGDFEMIWATGWEDRANDHLPHLLGLADDLPTLTFGGQARFGTAHWKLGPLQEFAHGRALAWIDDSLDDSCHAWAAERIEPTLLVPTESAIGLTDAQVEALLSWAGELDARVL